MSELTYIEPAEHIPFSVVRKQSRGSMYYRDIINHYNNINELLSNAVKDNMSFKEILHLTIEHKKWKRVLRWCLSHEYYNHQYSSSLPKTAINKLVNR